MNVHKTSFVSLNSHNTVHFTPNTNEKHPPYILSVNPSIAIQFSHFIYSNLSQIPKHNN